MKGVAGPAILVVGILVPPPFQGPFSNFLENC